MVYRELTRQQQLRLVRGVHELRTGGEVMRDDHVRVTSALVDHPPVVSAFGYRFDAPDRSIVISGDTSPTEDTINACNGCDVLIDEARAMEMVTKLPQDRRSFGAKNHTTSEQLAALADKAKPRLLIVYHAWISSWPSVAPSGWQPVVLTTGEFHSSADVLQKEIQSRYSGRFVIGQDLEVY